MSGEQNPDQAVSRRQAIKTALKAGAYAAPVVLSASIPNPASAQVTGGVGTLAGTITNASNGNPIAGATVTVLSLTATTNASGAYTLANVPSGARSVTVSATGFTSRTDTVTVAPAATTTYSTALVATTSDNRITIVLTWGALPADIDAHLTGPLSGSSGRFHCYWDDSTPVSHAALDVDDTDGFGPETIRVSQVSGVFVAGEYRYYVHDWDGPSFAGSNAIVAVFQNGVQLAQYAVSAATGAQTATYWSVFTFTLNATAGGGIVITPVQQLTDTAPSDMPPMRRKGARP